MEYGDVLRRQGALVRIPCNHGSIKQFKSACKEVQMTQLHQHIRFYISFAFVNTIGRFRVGFGVGPISNTIEH